MKKKYVRRMFIILLVAISVCLLMACSDSTNSTGIKLERDVTVGQYPDSSKTVKLKKGDTVDDISDIGDGWVKFKSNGQELTCPKDKLDRSIK